VARVDDTRKLAFFYVDSNNDVATVGTLAVLGDGKVYGSRFVQSLASNAATTQSLTLGLDYKDFVEDILLDPDESVVTPISYLHWSANYTGAWRRETRNWDFSAATGFGIRGLGNEPQEFADKRYRARPNYVYFRSEGGLMQRLPADFTLSARYAGQFAFDPLISNEQFAIGGARSVRGYLEAEALGDMGGHVNLEFGTPQLRIPSLQATAGAFAFLDLGLVSRIDPLPGEPSRMDLSSAGAGFQFTLWERVTGSLAWAYPLVPGDRTDEGDDRILFFIRGDW
jgi:hemolysin activation/secretion protein